MLRNSGINWQLPYHLPGTEAGTLHTVPLFILQLLHETGTLLFYRRGSKATCHA